MSKYTTELRFICEEAAGLSESVGYPDALTVIEQARPKIFNFDYPIFDKAYKPVLETKILKHFYTQEIGSETAALWKFRLNTAMNEIMPYYNELYKEGISIVNPLWDTDLEESMSKTTDRDEVGTGSKNREDTRQHSEEGDVKQTGTITDKGEHSRADTIKDTGTVGTGGTVTDSGTDSIAGTSANKNVRWDKYSETPQGSVSNLDNDTYLTSARKITDDGTGSTTLQNTTYGKVQTTNQTVTNNLTRSDELYETDENERTLNTDQQSTESSEERSSGAETSQEQRSAKTTEDYIIKRSGYQGINVLERFAQARELILDVDMMIIKDLQPLFMGLW